MQSIVYIYDLNRSLTIDSYIFSMCFQILLKANIMKQCKYRVIFGNNALHSQNYTTLGNWLMQEKYCKVPIFDRIEINSINYKLFIKLKTNYEKKSHY